MPLHSASSVASRRASWVLAPSFPTCLTLLRSLVVSRAAKLLGCRLKGSLANFLPPTTDGLACSRLASRRGTQRGVTQKRCGTRSPKSECPSREPMAKVPPKQRCAHEGLDRGRSPQGVVSRRRGRRSHRRAPRACQLPARPRRIEVARTMGETVFRVSLGRRESRRPRSVAGGEVGELRRVCGGRAAQALGAGAGAF